MKLDMIFNTRSENRIISYRLLQILLIFFFLQLLCGCIYFMDLGHAKREPWKPSKRPNVVLVKKPQKSTLIYSPTASTDTGGRYQIGYKNRVAALIGIDDYIQWPRLEGAVRDANNLRTILDRLEFDRFFELYDRDATRKKILKLLGDTLPQIVSEEDLVLIFFAGHGQTETLRNGTKRGYIIPVDADTESAFSSAISMEELRDLANRLPSKHILYVMDSCYSGLGFTRGIGISERSPGYIKKITELRAVQMIAAGMEGEQAIESGGQGLFTTYLIKALKGDADMNADGYITVSELGIYLRPNVTQASGNRQTPQFGTLEGSGEIVFKSTK